MVERRHTDDRTDEQGMGRALNRRGLIAGAAALAAAALAKQTAQPVAAAYTLMGDTGNVSSQATSITVTAGFAGGPVLDVDASAASAGNIDGINGHGRG